LPVESDAAVGRRVRCVCGALLGLVLTLWLFCHAGPFHPVAALALASACAAACGIAAMREGDAFWRRVIAVLGVWR
jgi:hypothetical protein